MKKVLSLFLMLFFFQHYSFAQDRHIIDSLEDKLKHLEASQQEIFLKSQQQIEKSNRSRTLGIASGMGGALLGMVLLAIIFYWQRNKITREKKISEEERLKAEVAKKQSEE